RSGFLSESDWPKLTRAAGILSEAPIFIDDSAALTVLDMRAKARRLQREHGLGLVVVDYLQLMRGFYGSESREREISEISRSLKELAKELSVPVIALSQLNRMVENRRPPIPVLADLRESGAIEQDADVIVFIYREEVYDRESLNKGVAEVIIGKQRNGPTGIVKLAFNSAITRFETLARDFESFAPPSDFE
ncbi:MAG: DnaB-like helicase C-terminal domain-containing protein, partial [Deltaproteobacteria bacterium]|nr:DnaB-like helicase C-terminal domain-containing protein [Deltaproteobacteria bacterium]